MGVELPVLHELLRDENGSRVPRTGEGGGLAAILKTFLALLCGAGVGITNFKGFLNLSEKTKLCAFVPLWQIITNYAPGSVSNLNKTFALFARFAVQKNNHQSSILAAIPIHLIRATCARKGIRVKNTSSPNE
jgi:hypothetical protein